MPECVFAYVSTLKAIPLCLQLSASRNKDRFALTATPEILYKASQGVSVYPKSQMISFLQA